MTDILFICFCFPLSVFCYYITKKERSKAVLIAFSIIFLLINGPFITLTALALSFFTYFCGFIYKRSKIAGKLCVALLVLVYIILLAGLHNEEIESLLSDYYLLQYYPVGLSFMMLSSFMYIRDISAQRTVINPGISDCILYLLYFPKFLLGPYVSYRRFQTLFKKRSCNSRTLSHGFSIFAVGFSEKVLIADTMYQFCSGIFSNDLKDCSVLLLWYNSLVYFLYIFFIFSSFSLMASGISLIFGIKLPQSTHPYLLSEGFLKLSRKWNTSVMNFFERNIASKTKPNSGINYSIPLLSWICFGIWFGFSVQSFLFGLAMGLLTDLEIRFTRKKKSNPIKKIFVLIVEVFLFTLLLPKNSFYILDYFKSMIFGLSKLSVWNNLSAYYLKEYFLIIIIAAFFAFFSGKSGIFMLYKILKNRRASKFFLAAITILIYAISAAVLIYRGGKTGIGFVI